MNKVIIIFGYNNTRIYDIERIKKYAHTEHDASIMLCKETLTSEDSRLTPYTLQIDFDKRDRLSLKDQMKKILEYTHHNKLQPIGCLSFSDKGIMLGSLFAASMNLAHDDPDVANACIDKYEFRVLEKSAVTPAWYKKPFFTRVFSYDEAVRIICESSYPLFLKPAQEGNSRGCIQVNSLEDLEENKELLLPYFKNGVMIEQCIQGCDEFSFDGVNDNYVITEKKTSAGRFRVETQHVVPAPLSDSHYERLYMAGLIVSWISGSSGGAVHNELFLDKATGNVYCVEPNRRPGGLKLWDWVSESFHGVDFWESWISWACSKPKRSGNLEELSSYTGCKMLEPSKSGILSSIDAKTIKKIQSLEGVVDIAVTKKIGATITTNLKDNSDFVGYVVCKSDNSEHLYDLLAKVSRLALSALIIH